MVQAMQSVEPSSQAVRDRSTVMAEVSRLVENLTHSLDVFDDGFGRWRNDLTIHPRT